MRDHDPSSAVIDAVSMATDDADVYAAFMARKAAPYTLYRFYDRDGTLLYVGITGRGVSRWTAHAAVKSWWTDVTTVRLTHFPTRHEAEVAEAQAIAAERPAHNTVHLVVRDPRPASSRRANGTGSFFQRQDGRWAVVFTDFGRRRYLYCGRSRTRAERIYREALERRRDLIAERTA